MVKVNVKYHGVIRDVTGEPGAAFEMMDDATVRDLLDQMHRKYGQGFSERVLDRRLGVRSYVILFLDGRQLDNAAVGITRLATGGQGAEAMVYVMSGACGGADPQTTQIDGLQISQISQIHL